MGWGKNAGKEPSSLARWDLGLKPRLLRCCSRRGWHSGAQVASMGSANSSRRRQRPECEARSYCPPLASPGQIESCVKQHTLVPRTEPAAGKHRQEFPATGSQAQLFISTASRPISLWLRLSAVLETGVGNLVFFLSPWHCLRQPNNIWKIEMSKQGCGCSSVDKGLTYPVGSPEWSPQCYTYWT